MDIIKISDTEYFSNDRTIRFLNMDCNEFMKGLKENEFDLNLSDPPYGINVSEKLGGEKRMSGKGAAMKTAFKKKDWDINIPDKSLFSNLFRTSKNQIVWGGNYFAEFLPNSMGWIVWDKNNGTTKFSDGELAFTSYDRALRIYNFTWNGMLQENMKNKEVRIHPTQKPIYLYRWVLQNYTKPSDTILDCFGGSMSHAIAAHMERRKLTIIELDSDYFKSALKRFDMYERQMKLF